MKCLIILFSCNDILFYYSVNFIVLKCNLQMIIMTFFRRNKRRKVNSVQRTMVRVKYISLDVQKILSHAFVLALFQDETQSGNHFLFHFSFESVRYKELIIEF